MSTPNETRPQRRTIHMGLDVRGALLLPDKRLRGWLRDDNGRLLSPREARVALMDELAKGHERLPLGEPCEGWDFKTGCPGHPVPEVSDAE